MRMTTIVRQVYGFMAVAILCAAALASSPATAMEQPDKMVEQITSKLLKDIVTYRSEIEAAEAEGQQEVLLSQFYDELQATLEPVIDFRLIARRVMGKHYKSASPEQFAQFREVFARSLVETYGRGLLTYSSDQDVIVVPLEEGALEKSKVVVIQKIQTVERAIPLYYSMWRNKQGEWKVVNLILDGINMGKTFHGQFEESARKYNGNIEKVIDNWSVSES
jgi:phospholipid transport system substrate-binding protein